MRLSPHVALQAPFARPKYDRDNQRVGMVHFGIGAFHRAHQAAYTDAAMNTGERDWMITGVSLRSSAVADQLNPQGGLYTVTERSPEGAVYRIIGSVRNVLVAAKQRHAVIAAIASPATRIISFTITEKGYCRGADGALDIEMAEQNSFYPLIAAGLRRRMADNAAGVTLLCCDNLSDNGRQLGLLFNQYLATCAPDLITWVSENCTFPSTMVDRIVPAASESDRDKLMETAGYRDEGIVVTEAFSQWVIEDRFANGRPCWDDVGATFTEDVRPYETAKLRMLNGAHSALAYVGLARGFSHVHEAIADPELRTLVENLMIEEAAPTVATAPGQDLNNYAAQILCRFSNSALPHRLSQIAMDGSQKIEQRWLQTLAEQRHRHKFCTSLLTGLAAWIIHIRGSQHVNDPMSALFADLWQKNGTSGIIDALFQPQFLGGSWQPNSDEKYFLQQKLSVFNS